MLKIPESAFSFGAGSIQHAVNLSNCCHVKATKQECKFCELVSNLQNTKSKAKSNFYSKYTDISLALRLPNKNPYLSHTINEWKSFSEKRSFTRILRASVRTQVF